MKSAPFAATPVEPDGDEAREWAVRELSGPEYDAATPTPIDRIGRAIGDFIAGLFGGDAPLGWDVTGLVVVAVVFVLIVAAAFLVWGLPRSVRRGRRAPDDIFDADDLRSAAQLRADAQGRAAAGDWNSAVVLAFRALARGLVERTLVDPSPGSTVHAFARSARRVFPAHADGLEAAASAFDDVRYLRRPGTADLYRLVADVDADIIAARPELAALSSGVSR